MLNPFMLVVELKTEVSQLSLVKPPSLTLLYPSGVSTGMVFVSCSQQDLDLV